MNSRSAEASSSAVSADAGSRCHRIGVPDQHAAAASTHGAVRPRCVASSCPSVSAPKLETNSAPTVCLRRVRHLQWGEAGVEIPGAHGADTAETGQWLLLGLSPAASSTSRSSRRLRPHGGRRLCPSSRLRRRSDPAGSACGWPAWSSCRRPAANCAVALGYVDGAVNVLSPLPILPIEVWFFTHAAGGCVAGDRRVHLLGRAAGRLLRAVGPDLSGLSFPPPGSGFYGMGHTGLRLRSGHEAADLQAVDARGSRRAPRTPR